MNAEFVKKKRLMCKEEEKEESKTKWNMKSKMNYESWEKKRPDEEEREIFILIFLPYLVWDEKEKDE